MGPLCTSPTTTASTQTNPTQSRLPFLRSSLSTAKEIYCTYVRASSNNTKTYKAALPCPDENSKVELAATAKVDERGCIQAQWHKARIDSPAHARLLSRFGRFLDQEKFSKNVSSDCRCGACCPNLHTRSTFQHIETCHCDNSCPGEVRSSAQLPRIFSHEHKPSKFMVLTKT